MKVYEGFRSCWPGNMPSRPETGKGLSGVHVHWIFDKKCVPCNNLKAIICYFYLRSQAHPLR